MPPGKKKSAPKQKPKAPAADYRHADQALARPDVGTQPQFRKRAAPKTYRYDSSLSPALDFDSANSAREQGEALIREILEANDLAAAKAAAEKLKALSRPFLNWSGKAERLSFDVPTVPLFIHERLSTQAILETLKGHRADRQHDLFDLFADPQRPIHDQVLRAYEYKDDWVNRMILGDSLVVMNSLLHYESLGGQVQMIYMDPPYGVQFGSNFQPFVRKRDVTHNDDEDMTREPEMVQAYRDTWELGLHSYLTYLRDRLLLARDLLAPTGSIFVQISDENLHHVREVMDEVFGPENAFVTIVLKKKGATTVTDPVNDYLLWYARDKERAKARITRLYEKRRSPEDDPKFNTIVSPTGEMARVHEISQVQLEQRLASGWRWARVNYPIVSQHYHPDRSQDYVFRGKPKSCGKNRQWSFDNPEDLDRLANAGRLFDGGGASLGGVVFWDDWPYVAISNVWNDLKGEEDPLYAVQTAWKAVQRCVLMTTEPGDLIIDPTCGSGTTAYMAEWWGRRWITIDASRVPLALARQRLLSATYPWYQLKDDKAGPIGGFEYVRQQNNKGEEIGGIVPQITLKAIAKNERPEEKRLVHIPAKVAGVTRVSGPFVVEATIPTTASVFSDDADGRDAEPEVQADYIHRMLEVLRRSPVLRLEGNRTVTLKSIRRPAKTLSLSAEATVDAPPGGRTESIAEAVSRADEANRVSLPFSQRPVAIVLGPEDGAIAERLVWEAAREAHAKSYTHLYVIGFAIQPPARQLVDSCEAAVGVPATYVQATPDLMMGDLLKNMRSSQIFSVCGLPEIELRKAKPPAHETSRERRAEPWHEVELLGLDVFDPSTMQVEHRKGSDVPAWFLDTDYNGLSFHVCQAFFPRTSAWDNLKRALRTEFEESVWQHLAGTVSVPFQAGKHAQVAVKVIDDRGNELMVVQPLEPPK